MSLVHTFAGNPLDRADALRRDPNWLARAEAAAESRFLPFANLNVLLDDAGTLGWMPGAALASLKLETPPVFLGCQDGVAHFAQDISAAPDVAGLAAGTRFVDCRMAAMSLDTPSTGIIAQARAQIDWHRRHRFCSACSAPSRPDRGGHVRRCDACGAEHFPRTDPVAIMLVIDATGTQCLLGQPAGRFAGSGFYSALAGFIDQGESIEEAVRREVREEAGIEVGAVRYHSSQPWPFPSSLMIGCHARARSETITIDRAEMADVAWFSRDEVKTALAEAHTALKVPGPIAIAHHLIQSWVEGRIEF
ncbi:MAG: NAD(+) diphosphatase [Pseudomonadales bacterium]